MVERDLALAGAEGRPIHLMHLSARESVAALDHALASGVAATGEVTPHHLVLTDEAVRSLDPNTKMNPPLRGEDDREALRDALRRGAISCVATDHAPHARQEKDVPFEEAPFGVTGLETAFAALYTHLVVPGVLTLETLLERMSAGPARAFGLDEPRIEVGARANLVALDLDAEWTVTEDGFRSLSANSWLLGRDASRAGRARRSPTAGWCSRRDRGLSRARGRHGLPRPLGRRRRRRVRRGRLHDRDDRLPGDGHRPELRGAARLLHDRRWSATTASPRSAASRQRRTRRRRSCARSAARSGRRGCASTAWSGSTGSTRARSSCACATRARCARRRSPTRDALAVADALEQVRAQPAMEGQALVAQVSTPEPLRLRRRGLAARRRRRLRREALDHAPARAAPARR